MPDCISTFGVWIARATDYLVAGANLLGLTLIRNLHSGSAPPFESDTSDQRFSKNRQVQPIDVRKDGDAVPMRIKLRISELSSNAFLENSRI